MLHIPEKKIFNNPLSINRVETALPFRKCLLIWTTTVRQIHSRWRYVLQVDEADRALTGPTVNADVDKAMAEQPGVVMRGASVQSWDSDNGREEDQRVHAEGRLDPPPDICGDPNCSRDDCKDLSYVDVFVYRASDVCCVPLPWMWSDDDSDPWAACRSTSSLLAWKTRPFQLCV